MGFLGVFCFVFLGGFFWVVFLLPTLGAGDGERLGRLCGQCRRACAQVRRAFLLRQQENVSGIASGSVYPFASETQVHYFLVHIRRYQFKRNKSKNMCKIFGEKVILYRGYSHEGTRTFLVRETL